MTAQTVTHLGVCFGRTLPAYGGFRKPAWLPLKGAAMADKSPRQHMSKKAGKSLKEKRVEKHLKAEAKDKAPIVPPSKQRP